MKILVTNDDGIYSPGLAALAESAARFGEVKVVAPDVEQSSMGHAVTHSRPLRMRTTPNLGFDALRVNGTPADCVALGCHLWDRVDAVLSGINLGLNIGNSTWHSGTLAAAKQGALLGVSSIALSATVGRRDEPDFTSLQPHVERVLELLFEDPRPELVNVNFPERPIGMRWTRQSVRHYDGRVVPVLDPMERQHYWLSVSPIEATEEDTDRWAIEHGFVSLTPLRLDLTDHARLAELDSRTPLGDERARPRVH